MHEQGLRNLFLHINRAVEGRPHFVDQRNQRCLLGFVNGLQLRNLAQETLVLQSDEKWVILHFMGNTSLHYDQLVLLRVDADQVQQEQANILVLLLREDRLAEDGLVSQRHGDLNILAVHGIQEQQVGLKERGEILPEAFRVSLVVIAHNILEYLSRKG